MRNGKWAYTMIALLALSAAMAQTGHASAQRKSGKAPLRVLFVGNSLTYVNNLPAIVRDLSLSDRRAKPFEYGMVVRGGATLQDLWEDGRAIAALHKGPWDYVVLQEQSQWPILDKTLMFLYARLFNAEISKTGAQVIFYLTFTNEENPENQPAITQAYDDIATELHARVAPVGVAWQLWREGHASTELYGPDERHPDVFGSYLAACVLYETIYRKTPLGLTGKVTIDADGPGAFTAELPRAQAAALQETADTAFQNAKAVLGSEAGPPPAAGSAH